MNKFLCLLLFISLIFTSCENDSSKCICGFCLSKNDEFIYFHKYNGLSSSIYRLDSSGLNLKLIIPSNNEISFYSPKLSQNEKKIVFIGLSLQNNTSSIFTANIDGSSIEQLTKDDGKIITNAFFSEYCNEIIYCKADTSSKYSPLGQSSSHGTDLYLLDLNSFKSNKISNLNAYILGDVSEINKDSLLIYYYVDNVGGMYIFPKKNPEKKERIYSKNDTEENSNLYYQPYYSKKYKKIIFSNGYGLYLMDENRKVKVIYDVSNGKIDDFCLFNTVPKVLFTITGDKTLYSINYDGTDLKKIKVQLP